MNKPNLIEPLNVMILPNGDAIDVNQICGFYQICGFRPDQYTVYMEKNGNQQLPIYKSGSQRGVITVRNRLIREWTERLNALEARRIAQEQMKRERERERVIHEANLAGLYANMQSRSAARQAKDDRLKDPGKMTDEERAADSARKWGWTK